MHVLNRTVFGVRDSRGTTLECLVTVRPGGFRYLFPTPRIYVAILQQAVCSPTRTEGCGGFEYAPKKIASVKSSTLATRIGSLGSRWLSDRSLGSGKPRSNNRVNIGKTKVHLTVYKQLAESWSDDAATPAGAGLEA